jgi:hypothetical protein
LSGFGNAHPRIDIVDRGGHDFPDKHHILRVFLLPGGSYQSPASTDQR